jgi:AraC-like DNA-binding protein
MCYLGFLSSVSAAPPPARLSQSTELVALRTIRDRLDRDYRRPLDVEALARESGLPPRLLISSFEIAYGRSPYGYLVARRAESTTSATE